MSNFVTYSCPNNHIIGQFNHRIDEKSKLSYMEGRCTDGTKLAKISGAKFTNDNITCPLNKIIGYRVLSYPDQNGEILRVKDFNVVCGKISDDSTKLNLLNNDYIMYLLIIVIIVLIFAFMIKIYKNKSNKIKKIS